MEDHQVQAQDRENLLHDLKLETQEFLHQNDVYVSNLKASMKSVSAKGIHGDGKKLGEGNRRLFNSSTTPEVEVLMVGNNFKSDT